MSKPVGCRWSRWIYFRCAPQKDLSGFGDPSVDAIGAFVGIFPEASASLYPGTVSARRLPGAQAEGQFAEPSIGALTTLPRAQKSQFQ
jgi:hypothetical protein